MSAAAFVDVVKDYPLGWWGRKSVRALDGISLTIPSGQVFGLLGPNRAGKTTLVKLLLTLARPTGGTVTRLGKPWSDRSTLGRVGYVHENHAFPRYLTPAQLLEYYGALGLMPYAELKKRVPPMLERVGLLDRRDDPIRTFSKGMLQRLGIAQAILNDPELLVLDEPNEGLDLFGRQLMADVIRERRAKGGTVILVSHVLAEAEQLCDRVAVIFRGKVLHTGPVAEMVAVKGRPRTLESALAELYKGAGA